MATEDIGNSINGTVNMTSLGSNSFEQVVHDFAHELAHILGQDHIWTQENGANYGNDTVPNTEENKGNLLNSMENKEKSLMNSSGTDITPQQTDQMKNTIEVNNAAPQYYENRK